MAVGNPEGEGLRGSSSWQLLTDWPLDDHRLHDTFDLLGEGVLPSLAHRSLLLRGQRLAYLAIVAVERNRFESQLPGVEVQLFDLLDGRVLGNVRGLGDRATDEGLNRAHHLDVAHVVDC